MVGTTDVKCDVSEFCQPTEQEIEFCERDCYENHLSRNLCSGLEVWNRGVDMHR